MASGKGALNNLRLEASQHLASTRGTSSVEWNYTCNVLDFGTKPARVLDDVCSRNDIFNSHCSTHDGASFCGCLYKLSGGRIWRQTWQNKLDATDPNCLSMVIAPLNRRVNSDITFSF
ncbi:hypothetical protein M2171_008490 [Bradyrhizobium japonicum USDA 38]|uniref:hypothetical protein n=1 Tax=Bradyrhizobium japonicum TaxID=375 RepID=UPI0012BC2C11|nr:hypothetical protein [Bradyrhizobium japonicum]MCS3899357.1 hypothetical protein [Bradyrhizobium japonicum USDA 38]MCS3942411.1 hypothetical protein [Bradyrhizobium japonicum]